MVSVVILRVESDTYPVLPPLARLEQQRHLHVLESTRKLITTGRKRPVTQSLVEEGIPEAGRVREQHAQRNGPLLGFHLAVGSQHLQVPQLRAESLEVSSVVELEHAALDELHAGHAREHLGARGDPEYGVERHGLRGGDAAFARGVREELVAMLINEDNDAARDAFWVCAGCVDGALEAGDGGC